MTSKNWPQRHDFLKRVRELLAIYPPTRPFYPGCERSYDEQLDNLARDTHRGKKELVVVNPSSFAGQQHPVFATEVPPDAFVTRKEAFCPILAEVPLDTEPTAEAFFPVAVKYCNEKYGSLSSLFSLSSLSLSLSLLSLSLCLFLSLFSLSLSLSLSTLPFFPPILEDLLFLIVHGH